MDQSGSGNKVVIGLVVVALLAIVATAVVVVSQNEDTVLDGGDGSSVVSSDSSSDQSDPNANFEDGSYTARGSYITPGGRESIDLTVTLSDGVITDAAIEQNAISGEAKNFQSLFANNFESAVVGKKVDSVNLSRVAGSSLTPIGFNSALDDIENQARA